MYYRSFVDTSQRRWNSQTVFERYYLESIVVQCLREQANAMSKFCVPGFTELPSYFGHFGLILLPGIYQIILIAAKIPFSFASGNKIPLRCPEVIHVHDKKCTVPVPSERSYKIGEGIASRTKHMISGFRSLSSELEGTLLQFEALMIGEDKMTKTERKEGREETVFIEFEIP
ncbi:MAG: hypothetical protein NXY57DRAFT_1016070 [Lentinula lateritia]|nr:MAG: hypothetical protein NXY57DRAFT_1016070 [Lentinula lateritia]